MNNDVTYPEPLQSNTTESIQKLYIIILGIYAYGNFFYEIIPPLVQFISVIRAISDALLFIAGIKFIFRVENSFLKKILLLFFIVSSITYYLNASSITLISHLNGLREPLVFIVSLAIITSIFHSPARRDFISRMNKFLVIFLIIQVPVAIYQFMRFGAGDLVGGTFSDGGSGMVSQVIFMAVYYFFMIRASKASGDGFEFNKIVPLLLLLIPVFINETKISFIYLGILLALQIKIQVNIGKMILSVVSGIVVLFLFAKILAATTNYTITSYFNMDVLDTYYFSDWVDLEDDEQDITRIGKLVITYSMFGDDLRKQIFGAGYGIMKGKNVIGSSEAGKEYERFYYGSRMMIFSTYIQGGIALAVIYLLLNFYHFTSSINRYLKSNFTRYKLFLFSIFLLMWVYNDALLVTYFSLFAVYFLIFIKCGDVGDAVVSDHKLLSTIET